MHGLLVVDKPAGPTSHDVVDRVRRSLGVKRVGHAGTLDPFATGVLPVCVGKATRLARFLAESDKVYRATVRLGFATTTDDLTGEPLGPERPVHIAPAALAAACRALTGPILQVPPMYSAKRVGGRRLYDLAREGKAIERTPVAVTVHALEVVEAEGARLVLDVRCSAGTYVRALARDLGQALGVDGHLTALRRTLSGGFGLERAIDWERLPSEARAWLLPLDDALPHLPAVRVGGPGLTALRHGRDLQRGLVLSGFPPHALPRFRVLDEAGALVALAVPRGFEPAGELPIEPVLHPDVVLVE
jgi:tRNA pseudouridine55 synthase